MADYATLLPALKTQYKTEDSRVIVFGGVLADRASEQPLFACASLVIL